MVGAFPFPLSGVVCGCLLHCFVGGFPHGVGVSGHPGFPWPPSTAGVERSITEGGSGVGATVGVERSITEGGFGVIEGAFLMGVSPSLSIISGDDDLGLSPRTCIGGRGPFLLIGCGTISITGRDESVLLRAAGRGARKWPWGYEGTAGWYGLRVKRIDPACA